jgi:uracil-DNA glycosylase family 4
MMTVMPPKKTKSKRANSLSPTEKTLAEIVGNDSFAKLADDIVECERCPRLRGYCEAVAREKKKAHRNEVYWGRPIPNFGDPEAKFVILGLAPAAHGANRTSRMFTGDRSGLWLYRALHKAGFANQFSYERADDGLELLNCVITATAHCAPPDNKPLPDEIDHCREYIVRTFALHKPRVVLALGSIAWTALFNELKRQGAWTAARPAFGHGVEVVLDDGRVCLGSYHPSQQNTFTGRLTEPMFDKIFARARRLLKV